VTTRDVGVDDLDGLFGCPEGNGPFLGVLALGGSEGGIPHYFLNLLVAEGFACLALAYYNTPGTQPALTEVPLERVERGLRWLREQPEVLARDGRVAVVGGSKGGELALLAAATFPDLVGPVVAYTPSHVVWAGIDFRNPMAPLRSSWSVAGQPLPFVPYPPGIGPSMTERGMSVLPIYERGLDNTAALDAAAIPIERATGPILLVSGGDDRMWPAARMCELAVERMGRAGRDASIRHLTFPDAGHVLFPFEAPSTAPMSFDLGGAPGAGSRAHARAWPEAVHVLRLGTQ
jgi:acetyl esterase/lipase